MRRINETLREILAVEIDRLKDPGLGFVTLTGVDTAPDLMSAKVFYSVLGDDEQHASTAAALKRAAPHLRSLLGRQVRLKFTPELRFTVDVSIEGGMRIDEVLRSLEEEDDEAGDRNGDPAGG
ncbi:30S ribosome-binding factor RbfA [bacterium]|nr:30S ribosome-binding factor RbfA [bacterium]